ncbi:MAG: primosomal protein N' [Rikenellaceae bacterium]
MLTPSLIEVVVPMALPYKRLTYRCPSGAVRVGMRVVVEVGSSRRVVGIVAKVTDGEGDGGGFGEKSKIKDIIEILDGISLLSSKDIEFTEWVASYYMCKVGEVVKYGYSPLLSVEMSRLSSSYKAVAKRAKESLKESVEGVFDLPRDKSIVLVHRELSEDSSSMALCSIVEALRRGAGAQSMGKHILVLCPTPREAAKVHKALERYFTVGLYTSAVAMKKRAHLVSQCASGLEPQVIVGTRIALWLPSERLGGVVVCDEDSRSYRSMRAPFYSARECALMLASLREVRCVLQSGFPSVESYYNAKYGQWGYIPPKGSEKKLRSIVLERGKDLVSKYTLEKIEKAIGEGKKAVLMQNRRGVASWTECEGCGYVPQCPNCSTSLNVHRTLLGCHYCGYSEPIEHQCKECGATMIPKGRGTQQIEAQIMAKFEGCNIVRLDSDSVADRELSARDVVKGKNDQWDIAIGTTMVLSSEVWDSVGVVAVLNVDNMLTAPDFRVEENALRTLGQLAQRCWAVDAELIIQSSRLDHRAVEAVLNENSQEFYDTQIIERKRAMFPPHSRMIRLELRGKELREVVDVASQLETKLRGFFAHRLSPIYQPSVERQRGEYIVEMTLKIARGESFARAKDILGDTLRGFMQKVRSGRVSIDIEVDPL